MQLNSPDNILFLPTDEKVYSVTNIINNYEEFLKFIKALEDAKIASKINVTRSDNNCFLFTNEKLDYLGNEKYLFIYKPEPEYLNLMNKIYGLNAARNYRYFAQTVKRYFAFIMPYEVYEVLFTAEKLRASNIELFTEFQKKCKNGKVRNIVAPNDELKKSLQNLNTLLQRVYDSKNKNFQVAYKKGKSVVNNAEIHKEKKYVFNIDLHDFFPSCKRELVRKYIDFLFGSSFTNSAIEEYFLDIILKDDGLFIGSPISGTLANAILAAPANYLYNICKKTNMNFSIYADDMSFSSDKFIVKEYIINLFNEAMQYYNLNTYFSLNEKKSIGFSNNNRHVTGVSINNDNSLTVRQHYYRDLRVKIHKLSIGEQFANSELQQLKGKLAYSLMIDESGKVYRYLKKFEKTVNQYKLISKKKFKELEAKYK